MRDFRKVTKRCVCGLSARMPLCDGSHDAAGWRCDAPGVEQVGLVFAASPFLRNLADRLAYETNGLSLHLMEGPVRCRRLVVISDGHGVGAWEKQWERVDADEILILGVGMAAAHLVRAYPDAGFVALPEEPLDALWTAAIAALDGPTTAISVAAPPSVFLSHAVVDERVLFPVIGQLRDHLALDLFVCADSIAPGTEWQSQIRDELRARDLFLFIASKAAITSAFCAFEAGMATAFEKTLRVVSLDGAPPPPHLQQIQATDVKRLRARKPWLRPTDALYEACVLAIAAEH